MRKASRDAMNVLENRDVEALRADMIRTRALVNCFTELGEAAARVTDEARRIASEVPWRQIVGMRHNLVHVYWGIDLRELVKTVRSDLPAFIAALDRVLGTQEMEPRAGRRPRSAKRKPKSG